MSIVHLSTDLMMGSQLSQAARSQGLTTRSIRTLDPGNDVWNPPPTLVVMDLQCPGWSAETFARLRTELPASVRFVAYAQHVMPELLAQAQAAGIEQVMTRGQFARSIDGLLQSLVSSTQAPTEQP